MEKVVVVDFGSQYAHLIARRIRELRVYSEIVPHSAAKDVLGGEGVRGIVLSGGPRSVYEEGSPKIDRDFLESALSRGIPILGICYGHQLLAYVMGGRVERGPKGEYGISKLEVLEEDEIFRGLPRVQEVWMSHRDLVVELPDGFEVLASTEYCAIAAYKCERAPVYGVQFHPEVVHTRYGKEILRNFLYSICGCSGNWVVEDLALRKMEEIRERAGEGNVLMAASGGVDSTTAAYLIGKALGFDRIHLVVIDTGLLREGEAEGAAEMLRRLGFSNVHLVDASDLFLERLRGITDPEEKRRVIASTYVEVLMAKARELEELYGDFRYLGQGTIYPDRIESGRAGSGSAKIKSHHNVVLSEALGLELLEPLLDLYKDEVRRLARSLGLPEEVIKRHPFPGPGLAIRIVGEVTREKLDVLRRVDRIVEEEMKKSGYYDKVWQAFPVLLPFKTVGVMGDERTYRYAVALRIVVSEDAMTAEFAKLPWELLEKISSRIVNEVLEVNRVLYDLTNKPPATIEFE